MSFGLESLFTLGSSPPSTVGIKTPATDASRFTDLDASPSLFGGGSRHDDADPDQSSTSTLSAGNLKSKKKKKTSSFRTVDPDWVAEIKDSIMTHHTEQFSALSRKMDDLMNMMKATQTALKEQGNQVAVPYEPMSEEEMVERVTKALKEWDHFQSIALAEKLVKLNLAEDKEVRVKSDALIKKRESDRIVFVTRLLKFLNRPRFGGGGGGGGPGSNDPEADEAAIRAIILSTSGLTNSDDGSATTASIGAMPPWTAKKGGAPCPGKRFIMIERKSKQALGLECGELTLVNLATAYGLQGVCWVWQCVEQKNGWLGFQNVASGTFLGHHGDGLLCGRSKDSKKIYETSVCLRQEGEKEWYFILMGVYPDGYLRKAGPVENVEGKFKCSIGQGEPSLWGFVDI